jgi:hypothetical protein
MLSSECLVWSTGPAKVRSGEITSMWISQKERMELCWFSFHSADLRTGRLCMTGAKRFIEQSE